MALVRGKLKNITSCVAARFPLGGSAQGRVQTVGMGRCVLLWRFYEFAEHGREMRDVSARRTHGSAPTASDEAGRKLSDVFCHLSVQNSEIKDVFCKNQSICFRTTSGYHRRSEVMCPLIVDASNLLSRGASALCFHQVDTQVRLCGIGALVHFPKGQSRRNANGNILSGYKVLAENPPPGSNNMGPLQWGVGRPCRMLETPKLGVPSCNGESGTPLQQTHMILNEALRLRKPSCHCGRWGPPCRPGCGRRCS